MAVRRISELPNLTANYGSNFDLSKSLIEVSYNPSEKIYQSFYVKLDAILANITNTILANLPRATYDEFGIVKIGHNVVVNTTGENKGLISVRDATTTQAGVIKAPGNSWPYVGTDANGNFIKAAEPSTTLVSSTDYAILNIVYPIGSLYIAANKDHPWPPNNGIVDYRREENPPRIICQINNGTSNRNMHWIRFEPGRSLWTVGDPETEPGTMLSGSLPKIPSYTCTSSGSHTHAIALRGSRVNADSTSNDDELVSINSAGRMYDPSSESNWSTDQKEGLKRYNALIANGATEDNIRTAAGINYDWKTDRNHKYGCFQNQYTFWDYVYSSTRPNNVADNAIAVAAYARIGELGMLWNRSSAWNFVAEYIEDYLKVKCYYIPLSKDRMENTGAHTHTLEQASSASSVYRKDNDTSDVVRPTSIGVVIWQRTD